jgi:hypothetical protein
MAAQDDGSPLRPVARDLRLEFLRGMGLWMSFLDRIPHDVVCWLTLRNYGFRDAAEFFVFISGHLAGFIYGPIVRTGHFLRPPRPPKAATRNPPVLHHMAGRQCGWHVPSRSHYHTIRFAVAAAPDFVTFQETPKHSAARDR